MTSDTLESVTACLLQASKAACEQFGIPPVSEARLDNALSGAIDARKLVNNLAEVWRVSPDEVRTVLEAHGFGGVLARLQATTTDDAADEAQGEPLSTVPVLMPADGRIKVRAFGPAFDEPVAAPQAVLDTVSKSLAAFLPNASKDVLGVLYRDNPAAYATKFLKEVAPRIDSYVREHFGEAGPRYLVNSGIGANEQFNYFTAALANARSGRRVTWLLANSPKEITNLPADATVKNTLFMEFSRLSLIHI